jgi:hypothetical protein
MVFDTRSEFVSAVYKLYRKKVPKAVKERAKIAQRISKRMDAKKKKFANERKKMFEHIIVQNDKLRGKKIKTIETIYGETILIDAADYERAKQYKWVVKLDTKTNRPRIVTYAKKEGGASTEEGWFRGISYKSLILGLGSKMTLHKNDNPFDLRRENIMAFDVESEYGEYISVMGKIYRKKDLPFSIERAKRQQRIILKTREKIKKKHKYIGVKLESRRNPNTVHPWYSYIKHNRERLYLGSYTKEEYAALAYDKKVLELYGADAALNFPELSLKEITKKLEQIKAEDAVIFLDHASKVMQGKRLKYKHKIKTSKYVGVCMPHDKDQWRAVIRFRAKTYYLGYHDIEEEAARAYDKKALELYGEKAKLNFPLNGAKKAVKSK